MQLFSSLAVLSVLAGSLASHPVQAEPATFVNVFDYASSHDSELSLNDYLGQLDSLKRQFDYLCGDTFCEGEYGNLVSMEFNCSVNPASLVLGQCAWSFAGTTSAIDPATGRVDVTPKFFQCDLGVHGTLADLKIFLAAAAVEGFGSIGIHDAVVPGTTKTLMEKLSECL